MNGRHDTRHNDTYIDDIQHFRSTQCKLRPVFVMMSVAVFIEILSVVMVSIITLSSNMVRAIILNVE